MAIGRTFKEALQKALRSLEIKRFGLCGDGADKRVDRETLQLKLSVPNAERIFYLAQAFRDGMSIDEIFDLTKIDRWFLRNIEQIVRAQEEIEQSAMESHRLRVLTEHQAVGIRPPIRSRPAFSRTADRLLRAKKMGFSDTQLGHLNSLKADGVRAARKRMSDPADLSAGRYLRSGVRSLHALLLFHLRRRERAARKRQAKDHDSRRRPESHRAGNRV